MLGIISAKGYITIVFFKFENIEMEKHLAIYYIATSNYKKGFIHFKKNIPYLYPEMRKTVVILSDGLTEWDNIIEGNITYKVYHIIGNHEQKSLIKKHKQLYKTYFDKLYKKNIVNLDNEKTKVEKDGKYINIYGLIIPLEYYPYFFKNYENKNMKLEQDFINNKLGEINRDEYNILLAHTPFFFEDYEKYGVDLVLAGHVHGGIIRLPKVGGLLSPNREFFPKYDFGKYIKNNTTMLLSKGLGGSKVLIRFACKPEIVSITLKSK